MPDAAIITALSAGGGVVGAVLLWLYQRAFGEGAHVQANKATDAAAAVALGRADLVAGALADHKADDARQFGELGARVEAVNDAVEDTKRLLANGIADIRADLRAMTVRIDGIAR